VTPEGLKRKFYRRTRRSKNGCLIWIGARFNHGYGQVRRKGKLVLAHREAWKMQRGPIPEGKDVLHDCDNPPCVEILHLFLGTHLDNMRDSAAKGRANRCHGEKHHRSKLNRRRVKQIRKAAANGVSHVAQAVRFGMHPSTIASVVKRENWKHVP